MKKKLYVSTVSLLLLILLLGCTNPTYEVKFVVNDSIEEVMEVEEGQTVKKIDNPISEDYLFLGWYTSDNYEEKFDFNKKIESDTTIYARFSQTKLGEENYIAFKENGLYGFMLPTGEVIVEAKYDRVEPFRYGYSLVNKLDKVTFIDVLGNEFTDWYNDYPAASMARMQFIEDGIAKLYVGDGIIDFIDNQGLIQFEIDTTEDIRPPMDAYFSNGLLPVNVYDETDGRDECVYYNLQGEVTLDNNYLTCSIFSEELAGVVVESGSVELENYKKHYIFINPLGETMFETDLDEIYKMFDGIKPVVFKEGYAIGRIPSSLSGNDIIPAKYVVINNQGETVIEFDNDKPVDVIEGYVLTKNNEGYYAIFDFSGNKVMDYLYQGEENMYYAKTISDGMVVLKNDQGKYGAIAVNSGDIIIDFEYDELLAFIDGYAVAKKNGLYGIIDKDNNVIVEFTYEDMLSVARTIIN